LSVKQILFYLDKGRLWLNLCSFKYAAPQKLMQKQKYRKRTTLQLTRPNYTLQRKQMMMYLSTHPQLIPLRTSSPSFTGTELVKHLHWFI